MRGLGAEIKGQFGLEVMDGHPAPTKSEASFRNTRCAAIAASTIAIRICRSRWGDRRHRGDHAYIATVVEGDCLFTAKGSVFFSYPLRRTSPSGAFLLPAISEALHARLARRGFMPSALPLARLGGSEGRTRAWRGMTPGKPHWSAQRTIRPHDQVTRGGGGSSPPPRPRHECTPPRLRQGK